MEFSSRRLSRLELHRGPGASLASLRSSDSFSFSPFLREVAASLAGHLGWFSLPGFMEPILNLATGAKSQWVVVPALMRVAPMLALMGWAWSRVRHARWTCHRDPGVATLQSPTFTSVHGLRRALAEAVVCLIRASDSLPDHSSCHW